MGHEGKHIIDPETGLCEICDSGAIQEVHQGRRPNKHVFYSKSDDRLTYRSAHDESPHAKDRYIYEVEDEQTPRYVRKSVYPSPTIRTQRVVYEEPNEQPIVVRRRVIQREHTPPGEVVIHRPPPPPRQAKYYYVDGEGQLIHQSRTPPMEPPRRYVVQGRHPPPPQTTRIIREPIHTTPPPARIIRREVVHTPPPAEYITHRQVRTPPPHVIERRYSEPKRKPYSHTEAMEREERIKDTDSYHRSMSPIRAEMYHIDTVPDRNSYTPPPDSPPYSSRDRNHTPPPPPVKMVYPNDRYRKPTRVEPIQHNNNHQPNPTVVKRVYKKLPPGKYEPPNEKTIPNGNRTRAVRRNDKNPSPPKHYQSSPQLNKNQRSPEPSSHPTVYYVRSTDNFH